jgi:hypothetical protein
MKLLFITVLFYISTVSARDVIFKVLGFGKQMQLSIGGQTYNLVNKNDKQPMFKGKILNVDDGAIEYSYIMDGVAEDFKRTLDAGSTINYNDFFGRQYTVKNL